MRLKGLKALVIASFLSLSLGTNARALERIPIGPEVKVRVTPNTIQVIRFPQQIAEAFVDASKGIQVRAQGPNLLIKWNPYYKKSAVIAVTTEDKRGKSHDYVIVAIPTREKPEVVELYLPEEEVEKSLSKKAAYYEHSMPYEAFIVHIAKEFMSGQYPDYYTAKEDKKLLGLFKEIEVWQTLTAYGDRFGVIKGYIINTLKEPIHIDETVLSFLDNHYDVKAISIRYHNLQPGQRTEFVVVVGRDGGY